MGLFSLGISCLNWHLVFKLISLFVQLILWISWLLTSCVVVFIYLSISIFVLQSFDPSYSLTFSNYELLECALVFTHFMRIAHIMEKLSLYGPSKIFLLILAMDANGGEVLEGLREPGRSCCALSLFLKLSLSCICILPYINPLKWDCHQLPIWGRLKEHGAPMCGFGN